MFDLSVMIGWSGEWEGLVYIAQVAVLRVYNHQQLWFQCTYLSQILWIISINRGNIGVQNNIVGSVNDM